MDKKIIDLIKRGELKCCICGLLIRSIKDVSVEHEPPKSRQNALGPSKIGYAHKKCNHDKGALTMGEYQLYLKLLRIKNGQDKSL